VCRSAHKLPVYGACRHFPASRDEYSGGMRILAGSHYLWRFVVGIIGFLVAGLIIGALARLIKPGRQHLSVLMTLVLGIAGSLIGGVIASLIGTGSVGELNVLGFIVAVIAAVLLIGVAEGLARDKTHA
jgi:uncharacterized membrane protein YeaQ/YmgE (transglycosylase-associated protein family)